MEKSLVSIRSLGSPRSLSYCFTHPPSLRTSEMMVNRGQGTVKVTQQTNEKEMSILLALQLASL